MPWHLDIIREGPTASRTLELKPGVTVTVGRVSGVTEVVEDDLLSPVHFAISLAGSSVRLQNLCETTGTEVNGQRTNAAILEPGDRIKAGNTTFIVHPPAPSPYPAQLSVGGWGFKSIPEGWQAIKGVGFQLAVENERQFRATITAVEEPLQIGQTLTSYIETQITLVRGRIAGISIDGPVAAAVPGAEEAFSLSIKVPVLDSPAVIQRQIYAVSSGIVGILTTTVSEAEPLADALKDTINGLSYFQG